MKRFYSDVAVVAGRHPALPHAIALDGRPVRTPARASLALPTRALADAVATEWAAQGELIAPATMALTGLANAAIDHALPDPVGFARPLTAYADADLLCYRDDRDSVLMARQEALWEPVLTEAEMRFDVRFARTRGMMPVDQPASVRTALGQAVAALDPFLLVALAPLVTIGGSLVAALAVVADPARAPALWPVVTLDEAYQAERWGEDAEAAASLSAREAEWNNAARFADLAGRAD